MGLRLSGRKVLHIKQLLDVQAGNLACFTNTGHEFKRAHFCRTHFVQCSEEFRRFIMIIILNQDSNLQLIPFTLFALLTFLPQKGKSTE